MRAIQHLAAAPEEAAKRRASGKRGGGTAGEGSDEAVDGYLEKLVKYVPAEIVTAFTLLATIASERATPALLWATFAFGIVTTPLLLYGTTRSKEQKHRPKFWMYLLSALAFVIWAVYMNDGVRELFPTAIDQAWATFLLVAGVIIIPAVDEILDYWAARVRIV